MGLNPYESFPTGDLASSTWTVPNIIGFIGLQIVLACGIAVLCITSGATEKHDGSSMRVRNLALLPSCHMRLRFAGPFARSACNERDRRVHATRSTVIVCTASAEAYGEAVVVPAYDRPLPQVCTGVNALLRRACNKMRF